MGDEPLGCLLRLIWLPYQFWQAMSAESRIGTSEMDRQVGRFWRIFAMIATIVVLSGGVAWVWFSIF